MKLLNKLPGSVSEPPGLEWKIMRHLPAAVVFSILVPAIAFGLAWYFPDPGQGETLEHYLHTAKIVAFATSLTAITAIFTLAIGCAIVWVMKGPAYVADAYPLQDSESPHCSDQTKTRSTKQRSP